MTAAILVTVAAAVAARISWILGYRKGRATMSDYALAATKELLRDATELLPGDMRIPVAVAFVRAQNARLRAKGLEVRP